MSEKEKTPQGVEYDSWTDGPQGAKFELFFRKSLHKIADVQKAKSYLRRNFDVVQIQVTWVDDTLTDTEVAAFQACEDIDWYNSPQEMFHAGYEFAKQKFGIEKP